MKIINDQQRRLDQIKILNEIEFQSLAKEVLSFDVMYHIIVEKYSYLIRCIIILTLKLSFILTEVDKFSWQFVNKGYFNFKNNMPNIL